MIQNIFIQQVVNKINEDKTILGLAAGGSFITGEIDEYSDVDLVLVTREKIAPDQEKMEAFARSVGDYLNGFTGEHVGEPRLLVCLYDNPLLHVDIKFVTLEEFRDRVEDPILFWDPTGALQATIDAHPSAWPMPGFQWLEDRFWTWVHYTVQKLGRGELFEAMEGISFIRATVLAPLLQLRNRQLPRGLRKVEFTFKEADMERLKGLIPVYDLSDIFDNLERMVTWYRELRRELFPDTVQIRKITEEKVMDYFHAQRREVWGDRVTENNQERKRL